MTWYGLSGSTFGSQVILCRLSDFHGLSLFDILVVKFIFSIVLPIDAPVLYFTKKNMRMDMGSKYFMIS